MKGRFWREQVPLIRPLFLLLGLLVLICGWLIQYGRFEGDSLDSRTWEWTAAGSFADESPPVSGWIPYPSKPNLHVESKAYWLRIPLPATDSREPRLWLTGVMAVRVYDDAGSLLYGYDPAERGHRINLLSRWNLAKLPIPVPARVDVLIENRAAYQPVPEIRLIDRGDLLAHLFRKDSYSFILASLHLFCSAIAFGLFWSRKDKLYLYFFLLAITGAYASAVRNSLLQMFWDQPWPGYLENAVFPLGVFSFISMLYELFYPLEKKLLNRLRWMMLGFSVAAGAAALIDPWFYDWLLRYPLPPFYLLTGLLIFRVLIKAFLQRRDLESVWMLAGSNVISAVATFHVVRNFMPYLYDWLAERIPLLKEMPFDLLQIGLLLFQIGLIRVIIHRFGVLNQQLTQFNRSLEQNVMSRTAELHERTAQLQETNARLAASMRETAEVMAESMILEERHRITGSIHDNVAHVLAATIVQLEAAKRLLDKDPRHAEDKVVASQQLVRKGLEEIRLSVRLLKEDANHYDLPAAMGALIRDTADASGIVVDSSIASLPSTLTTLQKRVFFQALQEGLSNGQRYGGCRKFHLRMEANGREVQFELSGDGTSFVPPGSGSGLRALSESVERLSGTLQVLEGQTVCILRVSLPYAPEASPTLEPHPSWNTLGGIDL